MASLNFYSHGCASGPELQAVHSPRASYKAVLLGHSCSIHQREEYRQQSAPSSEVSVLPTVPASRESDEGWQLVKPRRTHPRSVKKVEDVLRLQVERRARYLSKVRGLCFNCLAPGHKVALCCDPTRCWFCRHSGHISTVCPSRKGNKSANPSKSMFSSSDHQTSSLHHQPCSPPDQALVMMLHPRMLEAVADNITDPMCEEVELMVPSEIKKNITSSIPVSSATTNAGQESFKVAQVVTVAPQLMLGTPRMNTEEKTKTAEEQNSVLANELIKALGNLKQSRVAYLSPFTPESTSLKKEEIVIHPEASPQLAGASLSLQCRQNASLEKDSTMVCSKGIATYNHHRQTKIKFRKPVFKVTQDLLTRKWIFVKKDKQLSVLSKLAKPLGDLRLPPHLWSALVG